MTPACRSWSERFTAHLEERAALARRAAGVRPAAIVIAECLDLRIADLRRRLALAPAAAAAEVPDEVPDGLSAGVTWQSPVFNADGRFDPFAGTRRERMLASADCCRRNGNLAAAAAYEAHAAAALSVDEAPAPRRWGANADFSRPLPEPVPFTAGPQLDMFA